VVYLSGVLDLAVVVGEEVGKLCQINLGCGTTGEVVESAPPTFELFLVGFGAILGD
jgi:hypothetical protein